MNRHNALITSRTSYNQAGIALVLCLLFLTAMTLTGLNASADAILQNQLAANLKAQQQAEQASLDALSWAESWLHDLELSAPVSLAGMQQAGFQSASTNPSERLEQATLSWWRENAFPTGAYPENTGKTPASSHYQDGQSLWLVFPLHWQAPAFDGSQGTRGWYRIVARGGHSGDASVSVIESLFVRTWPSDVQVASASISNEPWCMTEPASCGRRAWRKLR